MLDRIKRMIYRLLVLGGVRAPARLLLQLVNANQAPALAPVPAAQRVLVLAPHMDDETIGCGGALRQHLAAGASVDVVFLTDGAEGFEHDERQRLTHDDRCAIRRRESEAACAVLGVSATHYLDLPDGRSRIEPTVVEAFLSLLDKVAPDIVYLPFLTDSHHDHRTCNALLLEAARTQPALDALLCNCYEVWTPLLPNHIVDISADIDTKMAALGCYESQLAMNNYLSSVRGLNAYRAIANRSQGYAEAFYLTTLGEYRKLASLLD